MAQVWFGGAFEEDGKVTFPNFAVEAEHVGARLSRLRRSRPQQLADFQRYRDGALVGRQIDAASTAGRSATASRCAARSGRSTSTSASSARSPTSARPLVWFQREYLDQALQAQGGRRPRHRRHDLGARRRPAQPVQRDHARDRRAVAQQRGRDRAARPRRASSRTSSARCRASSPIILVVTGLVALCIVFIAANTASMAVRERAGEIARAARRSASGAARIFAHAARRERCCCATLAGRARRARSPWASPRALRAVAGWSDALGPLGELHRHARR